LIVEIWQVRKKKREVCLRPVERWIISTAGAGVFLAALAAAAFWLWPFSLEQWGAAGIAVYVAYKWGEAIGTSREQLLQDERDAREGRPQANLLRGLTGGTGPSPEVN
jgi:hypothetical protein